MLCTVKKILYDINKIYFLDDMKTFLSESYDENQTKKSYSCEICLKEFPSNGALNSHNLIDHRYLPFKAYKSFIPILLSCVLLYSM